MEDVSTRGEGRTRPAFRPRDAWLFLLAALIVAGDQFTKWLIRNQLDLGEARLDIGIFKIVHVTNSGAAFGMLQGAGPLLAVTSLVGMAAIFVYLFNPAFAHPLMRAGLAFMLGGAIGNLIDRVRAGEVVDFLKVPDFPAFNVADSAITIGVMLLLWTLLTETEPSKRETS